MHTKDAQVKCLFLGGEFTGKNIDVIRNIVRPGVGVILIQLSRHNSPLVVIPALEALAHIASGNETSIQAIVDLGGMPRILRLLLSDGDVSVKIGALKVASKIAGGSINHIQETVAYGILYLFIDVFEMLTTEIKEETAGAILNVMSCGSTELLKIVTWRCLNSKFRVECLEGILRCVQFTELDQGLGDLMLPKLLKLLYFEYDYDFINRVLNLLEKTASSAHRIVSGQCVKPICQMLEGSNSTLIMKLLQGLEEIAKLWESEGVGILELRFILRRLKKLMA